MQTQLSVADFGGVSWASTPLFPFYVPFHVLVEAPRGLAEDPTGDQLDALICAIQAAWAWTMKAQRYGAPEGADALEGWIADPALSCAEPLA